MNYLRITYSIMHMNCCGVFFVQALQPYIPRKGTITRVYKVFNIHIMLCYHMTFTYINILLVNRSVIVYPTAHT